MKAKSLLYAVSAVFAVLSCSREAEETSFIETGSKVELVAAWADEENSGSRTAIQENGTSIWWTTGEEINAFFGAIAAGKFTSTNTEPVESATFSGTLNAFIGNIESVVQENACWAVYPYDAANTCDGESVTLTVSSEQVATEGTFADKFFPAVARANTFSLSFWNVCGGARFSVVQEGVQKVIFKSNDGSPMSGKVRVGFGDDNKPQILEILEPVDSVVVNAPEGGFVPGANYFAAMLPQKHVDGIIITLYTQDKKAYRELASTVLVKRSSFGILDSVDNGLEYMDAGTQSDLDPEGIIEFADSRIKEHCVAAFDTNGDGELSYGEAAAVTDISKAFTSTLYTSFDEFRFFTNITEIPANWFENRARLKSIAFPPNLHFINNDAFAGCGVLSKVEIPDIRTWIGIEYGNTASIPFNASGEGHLYSKGNELKEIIIPSGVTRIEDNAFYNCGTIERIVIPVGLSSIGDNAFFGCGQITVINVPDLASWLSIQYGNECAAPFNASGEGHLYINEGEVIKVIIPQAVTEIKPYAFYGCTSIEEITLNESLTVIGNDAFVKCVSLRRTNLFGINAWLNITFSNAGSAPFNTSGEGHLFIGEAEVTTISIPTSITAIKDYAFYNCTKVAEVTFTQSLTSVGNDAFNGCISLKRVNIPSLSAWMSIQFDNCQSAPFNVSKEGHLYINGMELKDAVIPETTVNIKQYAFYYCSGIDKMYLEPTAPPTLGVDALTGAMCWIIVWDECLDAYRNSWLEYNYWICSQSEELPDRTCVPVDLGLPSGLKWASCNLGAEYAYEYGGYYSMAEASSALDDNWRIPTASEWSELIDNCTCEWTTLNGVNGERITSKTPGYTNKWIFLPAAGYSDFSYVGSLGQYWSSTWKNNDGWVTMFFSSRSVGLGHGGSGPSVRPVKFTVTGVLLNESNLQLYVGQSITLTATIAPDNAPNKDVIWNSSDETVVTVSADGYVIAKSAGTAEITVTTVDGGYTARCAIQVTQYEAGAPEAVDLGLSVKWASFNLGASAPEEYGPYFAWGELAPKSDYSWLTYRWCMGSYSEMTKYCLRPDSGYNGFADYKTVLDSEDDAATVALGGNWRTPTYDDWKELFENCTMEWVTVNGVNGNKLTSTKPGYTDKWIFLPAAGYWGGTYNSGAGSYGDYRSSTLYGTVDSWYASLGPEKVVMSYYRDRFYGQSVRPVNGNLVRVTGVDLDQTEITLQYYLGEKTQLTATVFPSNAAEKNVIWKSSNPEIASVEYGTVVAVSPGTAVISAITVDGGYVATCVVHIPEYKAQTPNFIDLGLSVKWGSFNLGATNPEEFGHYFAWGEIAPKTDYQWSTYKWCNGSNVSLTKYCNVSSYGYRGFIDDYDNLMPEDDAATIALGANMRIPTHDEWKELLENCTWEWATVNGVNGQRVTSNKSGYTDKWIFLPAAGTRRTTSQNAENSWGYYWSLSLNIDNPSTVWCIKFRSNVHEFMDVNRCAGLSIRPVCE